MQQFLSKKPIKVLSVILGIILMFSGLILTLSLEKPQIAKAAWYSDAAWLYRQKIVIDHTKVANSNQTDFPVMIKVTNQYSGVFSNAKDDGTDILFTSDNGSTKLSHEIDIFSKTNKELIAWVKVPTLSYTVDTTVYMYYGNAGATDQQNKTDVWSNGYAGVWHMDETGTGSAGDFKDSTSGNHNSVNTASQPIATTGVVGRGQRFASNSYIDAGDGSASFTSGDFAMSIWIENYSAGYRMLSWGSSGPTMWVTTGNTFSLVHAGTIDFQSSFNPGSARTHLVVSRVGSTVTLFANGAQVAQNTNFNVSFSAAGNIGIGANYGGSYPDYITATLDEPRLSASRSADWLATEYNNQVNPEGFICINYQLSQDNYETATEVNWISSAWLYKQKIRITNNTATNLNNVQVLVSSSSVDLSNVFAKAKTNGEDIRFTSVGSSIELPYYIESYSSVGTSARIYVKVPYLPASGTTDIYLYYGNPNASVSTSSGASTFISFDDFSDGSLDSKWTVTTGNGAISESGGALNFNYTGSENNDWWVTRYNKILKLNDLPTGNYSVEVLINSFTAGNTTESGLGIYKSDADTYAITRGRWDAQAKNGYLVDRIGTTFAIASNATTTTPMYLSMRCQTLNCNFWTSPDRTTWTQLGGTYSMATFTNIVLFGKEWGSANHSFSMDDFRIKNYVVTDPSVTLNGSEEILDNVAPSNPSVFVGKNVLGGLVTIDPSNFYNYATPHFDWPAVGQGGGASDDVTGIDGYYLYFGDSCGVGGADPTISRGVLSDTGSGLHYTSATEISTPALTNNTYCLRLKTKDVAGNVSETVEAFNYKFESASPTSPSYIAANPAGYSSTNSFAFSWPASSEQASSPQSGLAGYQYKRGGTSGDDWSAVQAETSVSSILSYKTGENIFLVRAIDNAGNTSAEVQTTYYYSDSVPTKPTSIVVTPALSETNSFAFSWTAPAHSIPISQYGYSINAAPTLQNLTWTGSDSPSLSADNYATIQGDNTIYIVAKDESGAYGLEVENYGTATFNCTTAAPPIPTGVAVSDSSNRTIDLWALTIKWSAGPGQDPATFDHYSIERSTDNINFAQIATTSSTAYIDSTGLSNTTTYYYQIKSVDNAGSDSSPSTVVSKMPTGKFATPPTIITSPTYTVTATAATISWVVNRASTSAVRFGKSESDLSRSQIDSTEKTSQSISLVGLDPGTEYFYQVQSLDNYRDYSSESAYSSTYKFTTLAAPGISNVLVSNINLTSSDISWETTSASNTKVYFGTSISYGTVLPEDNSSLTTKHTVKLENLIHTTKYHFKIEGDDIDGNHLSSDDYTFETLPMPKISNISYIPDFTGPSPQVTISWITNVPTTSSVNYTPVSPEDAVSFEESQSALVKEHRVILAKMQNDTDYRFVISGRDQFGNLVQSDNQVLKTGADSRPPSISEVNVETSNIGLNSRDRARIIISWKTDEPSTGDIEYDEGISGTTYRRKIQADPGLSTEHVVIISDLKPQSPYHFKIIAKDKEENKGEDIDRTVISGEISQSVFNIIVETLTNLFGWLGKLF